MVRFFKPEEEERIIAAVREAESNTSGEIRIHLHTDIEEGLMEDAQRTFLELQMHQTKARNGVLIFLVPRRKQFAILGDEGIDQVTPDHFWEDVRDTMQAAFRQGEYAEGVCRGARQIGEKLKAFFPIQEDDENELSDDISYG